MPETSWLDTLLLDSLAIVIAGFAFVSAVEGWRRWSEYRRLKKHFRSSGKPRKLAGGSSPITAPSLDQTTEDWASKSGAGSQSPSLSPEATKNPPGSIKRHGSIGRAISRDTFPQAWHWNAL
jgi:hypothetical protein